MSLRRNDDPAPPPGLLAGETERKTVKYLLFMSRLDSGEKEKNLFLLPLAQTAELGEQKESDHLDEGV